MAQLQHMNIVSIDELESELGSVKWPRFVKRCEDNLHAYLLTTVRRILGNHHIRAIFVSGPTSSGKTTFSNRMSDLLGSHGRKTTVLSMDDYYSLKHERYDDKGRPDFESLETLDTDRMVEDFADLIAGRKVELPTFDFITRRRYFEPHKQLQLADDEIVLVEGLHGLSDHVVGQLDAHQVYKIFIMPWCTLLDGRQLLGSSDLRMLRRISRDVLHRGSTALSTIDYWPMIDRTEDVLFPPYLANADTYVNSCLPYEFCVIAPLAARQIEASLEQYEIGRLPGSIYQKGQIGYADLPAAVMQARQLLEACSKIPSADRSVVPDRSILNEFIH